LEHSAVVDWLLEPANPSVRYFALLDLLGRGPRDAEVVRAREEIMGSDPVVRILSRQSAGGFWGRAEDYYARSKYKGTIWNLILLAELGVSGKDERIKNACEFVIERSQDESGGFCAMPRVAGEKRRGLVPCYTGNMAFALIRFGMGRDERVLRAVEFLTRYQRFDDGDGRPKGFPYDGHLDCYGKHTCYAGVVKTLKALAEIPPGRRDADMKRTVETGAEFLLIHHLYKRSHDLSKPAQKRWTDLGFPQFWDTDALEMLLILTKLGIGDERMSDAIELIEGKRGEDGRWKLERSYNGRTLVRIERDGTASKWVTLGALTALGRLGS
jgi:hypothetical protein